MAKRSQRLQDFASPKVIKVGGARCPGQLIQLGRSNVTKHIRTS